MDKKIYLDNGATTKVDLQVSEEIRKYETQKYGNSSSQHFFGEEALNALETARQKIAKTINAKDPKEITFTSGGTESNNFAIKGVAFANKDKGNHILISTVEHDCVLNAARWLEKFGFKIEYLEVDEEGFVTEEELESKINDKTILVSIIHGHNEIGTIQDMEKLGKICKKHGVYFHTDACQSYMKTKLDVENFNLDLVTLNAHKIHGPKGVGALYIKTGTKIDPLLHGGGQEFKHRSGTVNVSGIMGFARSVEIVREEDLEKMRKLRDYTISEILEKIPNSKLNGAKGDKRLCNNINISFEAIEGESIVSLLDMAGIAVSTGSACSSNSLEPSHVLMAIEDNAERAHSSIRIGLSKWTTKDEIDYLVDQLQKIVQKLRELSPLEVKT